MTDHCNLPEGFSAGAAIRIEPECGSIRSALHELMRMPPEHLLRAGCKGRALAAERFSWTSVAERLEEVYQWLTGRGERPACVITAD
jgi:poly(glycerol-phosphate) alpha-glucosyltransferase